jgi:hypothetical protein
MPIEAVKLSTSSFLGTLDTFCALGIEFEAGLLVAVGLVVAGLLAAGLLEGPFDVSPSSLHLILILIRIIA